MGACYTESVTYKCYNDCRMEGCPGHTVRLKEKHGGVEIEDLDAEGNVTGRTWLTELGLWTAIRHLSWT